MSEAIAVPFEEKVAQLGSGLPITRQDVDQALERRKLLIEFVKYQLKEGVDYGKIAGMPKDTLFQPGAQKLARLFGLSVEKEKTEAVVNKEENFAMYTYKSHVTHIASGKLIAQCEGSCNSQEKKYAMRGGQATPIYDILNTLMKMAQKRSFVGGIIEATGASEVFTQDIDDPEDADQAGVKPPPTKVNVSVPKVTQAKTDGSVEICDCGNQMMISKYGPEPRPWYCTNCKTTRAR